VLVLRAVVDQQQHTRRGQALHQSLEERLCLRIIHAGLETLSSGCPWAFASSHWLQGSSVRWIDTGDTALLETLVESLPTARVLAAGQLPPEVSKHGWGSKTYYTQLRLDPLPPASAAESAPGPVGDDPVWCRSRRSSSPARG